MTNQKQASDEQVKWKPEPDIKHCPACGGAVKPTYYPSTYWCNKCQRGWLIR